MPNVLLDRISLPNLRLYTSISVLLVSCCVYYAISSTSDPFWRLDNNVTSPDSIFSLNAESLIGLGNGEQAQHHQSNNILVGALKKAVSVDAVDNNNGELENVGNVESQHRQPQQSQLYTIISPDQRKLFNDTRTIGNKFKDVVSFMVQEPICIWVSKNFISFVFRFIKI